MKTFVFDNNYSQNTIAEIPTWYFLADSSLTNAGKPFFVPDFADYFEAIPVIAIRVNRLGKSIASRFAGRYFSEFATAIHFRAKDMMEKLYDMHLPIDKAISFDRSLIMSEYMPFPADGDVTVVMNKNGIAVSEFDSSKLMMPINQIISEVSYSNTLKMGDLIIPALPEGVEVAIDDVLELSCNGESTLSVHIK